MDLESSRGARQETYIEISNVFPSSDLCYKKIRGTRPSDGDREMGAVLGGKVRECLFEEMRF